MSVQLWEPEHQCQVHARTFALLAFVLLAAVIIQITVVTRLRLPGGHADLVLVLLATCALVEGPVNGALLGFVTGLFGDLASTHVLGESALVLCLVGYLMGHAADVVAGSVPRALLAVACATVAGRLAEVMAAIVLGDAAVGSAGPVILSAVMAGVYSALLTPFLYPVCAFAARRARRGRRR